MTGAPKAAKTSEQRAWVDELRDAVTEVDEVRQQATGELRARLDGSVKRLRGLVAEVRERAGDEEQEFEASLGRASRHLRLELGRRAIRAQESTEALTELSAEIRKRKAQLTA